tara:strand:+ start:700 stop:825 length:126 start_codon:yes stop_codon:yes gene_type:complete
MKPKTQKMMNEIEKMPLSELYHLQSWIELIIAGCEEELQEE